MKIKIKNIYPLVLLSALLVIVSSGCNKTLIVEPDACFTTNIIDSLGEYVEAAEFEVGEEIHFVSCGLALFEVVYTGERIISKELTRPDGSDSIVFKLNSYFPDKSSAELVNYFDSKGKHLSISGETMTQAGEVREFVYSYRTEGVYEVYLEAINRNEDGVTTKATMNKEIRIVAKK